MIFSTSARYCAGGATDAVTVSRPEEVYGKKSTIYRLPACSGYAGMNPAAVVMFAHEATAPQAVYRQAKHCP